MGRGVVFWNPYTMHVLARADGHASNVRHCLVDEESGRVITVSTDKAVRCWDSATFRCIQARRPGGAGCTQDNSHKLPYAIVVDH